MPFERRELAPGEEPDPATLARDPRLLSAYLDRHPEKLDAKSMDPALLATLSQLLLSGGRYFEAERLLYQGVRQWPENTDIARRWAAMVVRVGRTEAARRVLERLAPTSQEPAVFYMLGVVFLRHEPRTQEDTQAVVSNWQRTLALNPNYRDEDGTTAEQIRNGIAKLSKDLPPTPAPESAPAAAPPSGR